MEILGTKAAPLVSPCPVVVSDGQVVVVVGLCVVVVSFRPSAQRLLGDQGKRVVSKDVIGVQGAFIGLCDFRVGVHVCPFIGVSDRVV